MPSPAAPGPLIGVGRSADVFDIGRGRVLRRYRNPDVSTTREAAVMRWAADAGYPVPAVHDADGPDLVLDRLEGVTLRADVAARPWSLWRAGELLADLHDRLHALDASGLLGGGVVTRRAGEGAALVHLDLHPENVVVTPDGPYVIDWANAAVGDGDYDVAYVWMVLSIATLGGSGVQRPIEAAGRRILRRAFLRHVDTDALWAPLAEIAGGGVVSLANFDDVELARLRRLVAAAGGGRRGAIQQ